MKKIYTLVMAALLLGLSVLCWFGPAESFSFSERRYLAQLPELSGKSLLSGKFMQDFERYSQDQFPLRDSFRSLKANAALRLFRQKDNNDLFLWQNHIFKRDYPLRQPMLDHAAGKMEQVYKQYLEDTDCKLWFSIVPDKSNYVPSERAMLTADFEDLEAYLLEKTSYMEYVDLEPYLSLSDYYRTDSHWKQEAIGDVAEALAKAMDAEALSYYEHHTLDTPFYGVYAGQLGLKAQPDKLSYITNAMIENCSVTSYDTGKPQEVDFYDFAAAQGRDPYEMFLNGADALLVIENPNAAGERELVLFRDSFGSSLAPLLLESYSRITLVDLRYIQSSMLGHFLEFKDQDVLFLYSAGLLNDSLALK